MRRPRQWLPIAGFSLLLGTCGLQLVRNAVAAPVTTPVAKDMAKSERTAASRVGGADERLPLPALGGEVVGGNGVVEPAQRETRVAAQSTALVQAVLVQEGDQVKAGALLVQLANGVETAALAATEAELEGERATLARTTKGLRVEDVDAAASEAQAAKSRAELSASVQARTEQLAKTGAATADELERARRQAQADQATWKSLDARARAAESGSRREDIAFQRARVQAAEARVAQARAALERLSVKAPLDAEVLQVKVRPGELYSFQGTEPLVVLGDTRRLRVRMDLDERDVARVRVGSTAYVRADAWGERRFPGKVVEIARRFGRKNVRTDDPTEKNDTKTLETVIELETNELLIPGQRVTCFVTASGEPS
jgi:HlyD family secretion protein